MNTDPHGGGDPPRSNDPPGNNGSGLNNTGHMDWKLNYSNPVVVLAILIVVSVILLVGAAVLGIDKGVLVGMSRPDYARGLITYLFALVTIGIAMALVISTSIANIDFNDRFQKGKEVLALLLGVFGTILGFYFASERTQSEALQSSSLDLSPQPVAMSGQLTVRAVARGGTPPYRFVVAQGKPAAETTDLAGEGGWISKQIQLRPPATGESRSIYLTIEDATKKKIEEEAPIKFEPP
jgi:hypothetical protein